MPQFDHNIGCGHNINTIMIVKIVIIIIIDAAQSSSSSSISSPSTSPSDPPVPKYHDHDQEVCGGAEPGQDLGDADHVDDHISYMIIIFYDSHHI